MIALFDVAIPTEGREGSKSRTREVSMKLSADTWHEIVGPSGVGKSRLFEVLTLRRRPRRGRLVIAGRNIDRLDAGDLAQVRRELGSCCQDPVLLPRRSILENTILPMVVRKRADEAVEAAEKTLGFFGMFDRREQPVCELSDQQRRLVAIARATVGTPSIVVVDGVHEQLEPAVRGMVLSWFEKLCGGGTTLILLGRRAMSRGGDANVWRIGRQGIEEPSEVTTC